MEKVAEIRLPLTIVADGTKAVAQLEKFKGQAGSISQKLRGYFQGEASGAVGMLSGYFGIQGAISGLKELYAMGQRVNKLSETYSPDAARAGAQRDIAQVKNDQILAKQNAPNAVESANREADALKSKTNALPNLASAFSTWVGGVYSIAENNANALTELLRGDTEEAKKSFAKSIAQASDSYQVGLSDFGQQNILKVSRAIALPELPEEVQAQNARIAMPQFDAVNAAAIAANDPFAATNAEALQVIARNTRGQR
jgi:hypothetical protein